MSIVSKLIYRVNTISIKIPNSFFTDLEKILKFIWENKTPQIATATPSEKKQYREIIILDFKLYNRAMVIKTARYWHKNGPVDQC